MRVRVSQILCGLGLALVCCSAAFLAGPYDPAGRREWNSCKQERRQYQRSADGSRSAHCLALERRFLIGSAMIAGGLILLIVARPGRRARQARARRAH